VERTQERACRCVGAGVQEQVSVIRSGYREIFLPPFGRPSELVNEVRCTNNRTNFLSLSGMPPHNLGCAPRRPYPSVKRKRIPHLRVMGRKIGSSNRISNLPPAIQTSSGKWQKRTV
jgi:hypothetical protein